MSFKLQKYVNIYQMRRKDKSKKTKDRQLFIGLQLWNVSL